MTATQISRNARVWKLTFTALFLALALVLPFLTGQIPTIGSMLSPMHLPAMLCGFVCGWPWGMAVGFISPILRSLIFGMPPMFPVATAMAFEMAAYGFVCGLLSQKLPAFRGRLYVTLISAMVAGRVVWGLVRFVLAGLSSTTFSLQMFMAGAVLNAVPALVLQLVVIPPLVLLMTKAGLNLNQK